MVTLEHYIDNLELIEVAIFEESVKRNFEVDKQLSEDQFTFENTFTLQNSEKTSTFRFKFTLQSQLSTILVDLGVIFANPSQIEVEREVQLEFASKVALMVAYPYVRSSIWASAARLGLPRPTLGLIRPDQIKFESLP